MSFAANQPYSSCSATACGDCAAMRSFFRMIIAGIVLAMSVIFLALPAIVESLILRLSLVAVIFLVLVLIVPPLIQFRKR